MLNLVFSILWATREGMMERNVRLKTSKKHGGGVVLQSSAMRWHIQNEVGIEE